MASSLKAFAIGVVGAIGALGAVELAAQSDGQRFAGGGEYRSDTDIVLREPDGAVWHISQGKIRRCRWNVSNFGSDVICTAWQ